MCPPKAQTDLWSQADQLTHFHFAVKMSAFLPRSGPLQRRHREDDGLQARPLLEALLEVCQPGFSAGENIKVKHCNCCIWLFVPRRDDPSWTKNKPDTLFWFNVEQICLFYLTARAISRNQSIHFKPTSWVWTPSQSVLNQLCYNSVTPGLFGFYWHLFHHQGWTLNLFQANVISACVGLLTYFLFLLEMPF